MDNIFLFHPSHTYSSACAFPSADQGPEGLAPVEAGQRGAPVTAEAVQRAALHVGAGALRRLHRREGTLSGGSMIRGHHQMIAGASEAYAGIRRMSVLIYWYPQC